MKTRIMRGLVVFFAVAMVANVSSWGENKSKSVPAQISSPPIQTAIGCAANFSGTIILGSVNICTPPELDKPKKYNSPVSVKKSTPSTTPIERALRKAEEHLLWVERGGDSFPYLAPNFDPDATRLFIHNDSVYSAYLVYREIGGKVYFADGRVEPIRFAFNDFLEVLGGKPRWTMDLYLTPSIQKVDLVFGGMARNVDFNQELRFFQKDGHWTCSTDVTIDGNPKSVNLKNCP